MEEQRNLAVTFTVEEIEAMRLERLAEAAVDRDVDQTTLVAQVAPGSFSCHEALHTTSVVMDMLDSHVCDHPSVLADPEWYRLASEASTALYNLYQAIGAKHL